ncbi:MAG: molybdenum cofactor biosynthesis protein MoaE [Paenibacillaceae bacterium]|nr:molybdenum cofactor biosynthesis protein MoaE [Paenibacillaceae bacterium]
MKLTVHVFAGLADVLGGPRIDIEAPGPAIAAEQLKSLLALRYPAAASLLELTFIAVNQAYAEADAMITEADEIALIPPVSGGQEPEAPAMAAITREPIDADAVATLVLRPDHGATLTFIGTTRELTYGKRTTRLEYDAYEPMALATIRQIGDEIAARWPGALCAIAHRIGVVAIGEASVVIAVSTPHRAACYEASRFAIERLKQIVPIWKKEIWEDGSEWQGHQQGPWNPLANAAD